MKDYLARRAAWLDGQFFRPPNFSHPGGVVSAQFSLTISNTIGTTGTIYFTVDGSDPIDGGGSIYTGPLAFNATAHVRARIRDAGGDWSALNEASYVTGTPAGPGDLAISEIMYHPFGDPGAEFLEVININPIESLDLALVRFAAGVEFTFPVAPPLLPVSASSLSATTSRSKPCMDRVIPSPANFNWTAPSTTAVITSCSSMQVEASSSTSAMVMIPPGQNRLMGTATPWS